MEQAPRPVVGEVDDKSCQLQATEWSHISIIFCLCRIRTRDEQDKKNDPGLNYDNPCGWLIKEKPTTRVQVQAHLFPQGKQYFYPALPST